MAPLLRPQPLLLVLLLILLVASFSHFPCSLAVSPSSPPPPLSCSHFRCRLLLSMFLIAFHGLAGGERVDEAGVGGAWAEIGADRRGQAATAE
ncbi:hypothetical protein Cni_G09656 [Canna indica]|uniref:Uncharacterized protein n=1 Tax=Canna indica TaxID=4628 RepID=A0AAQ3Q9I3_9LILI|nr:hypothetical protein Cni_G09656 [Canna indica]